MRNKLIAVSVAFCFAGAMASAAAVTEPGGAEARLPIDNVSRKQSEPEDEMRLLRERLNVPSSTTIRKINSKTLPGSAALRLHVATVEDQNVRNLLVEWVNKWNRQSGNKYGRIEVVADAARADVLLVRVALPVYFPEPHQSKLKASEQIVRAGVYLVVRKPSELEIWWRWGELITLGEYRLASRNIVVELERRMKERAKENKRRSPVSTGSVLTHGRPA